MPTDAYLTADRDIRIDPTGDIATVAGRSNTRVQHANALFRAAESVRAQLADVNAAADLRAAIESELRALNSVSESTVTVEPDAPGVLVATVETDVLDSAVEREVAV